MPYIKQQDREELDEWEVPKSAGDLNYVIHLELERYLIEKGESYQTYNDMIGALECAKLELYRRRISKYEALKAEENGDISFYKGY
jgi:hypothetical protein